MQDDWRVFRSKDGAGLIWIYLEYAHYEHILLIPSQIDSTSLGLLEDVEQAEENTAMAEKSYAEA